MYDTCNQLFTYSVGTNDRVDDIPCRHDFTVAGAGDNLVN